MCRSQVPLRRFVGEVAAHMLPNPCHNWRHVFTVTHTAWRFLARSEALRAAMVWAETAHEGRRMTCIIEPDNAASLRLAARLGFTEVARAPYDGRLVVVLERFGAGL